MVFISMGKLPVDDVCPYSARQPARPAGMARAVTRLSLLAAAVASAACSGQIGEPGASPSSGGGGGGGGTTTTTPGALCKKTFAPGRAPLRRLTRFEYNNTVRDLLGDTSQPANALPAEELGNGFGNDADAQSVSSLLAEQYGDGRRGGSRRARPRRRRRSPSSRRARASVTTATERGLRAHDHRDASCRARTGARCSAGEVERAARALPQPIARRRHVRDQRRGGDRGGPAVAGLPLPGRVRRARRGAAATGSARPATRWRRASRTCSGGRCRTRRCAPRPLAGELGTAEGVLAPRRRACSTTRARAVVRFFFDNLLPIGGLTDLERDQILFPTFSPTIGALMREETQRFLEHEIFEGAGTWPAALTAPYTFVNATLAAFYGIPGVTGDDVPEGAARHEQAARPAHAGGRDGGHDALERDQPGGARLVHRAEADVQDHPAADAATSWPRSSRPSRTPARPRASASPRTARKIRSAPRATSSMDPIGLALENFDPVGPVARHRERRDHRRERRGAGRRRAR